MSVTKHRRGLNKARSQCFQKNSRNFGSWAQFQCVYRGWAWSPQQAILWTQTGYPPVQLSSDTVCSQTVPELTG